MNDQHPHAGYVGYDNYPTGSYDTDPLFGALPAQQTATYETYDSGYAAPYAYPSGQGDGGQYDAAQWDTGAHQQAPYDAYAAQPHPQAPQQYDATATWTPQAMGTGQWDSTGWDGTGQAAQEGQWAASDTGAYGTTSYETGGYGAGTGYETGGYGATGTGYGTTGYGTTGYETPGYETGGYGTGAYDATAWNSGASPETAPYEPEQTSYPPYEQQAAEPGTTQYGVPEPEADTMTAVGSAPDEAAPDELTAPDEADPLDESDTTDEPHRVTGVAAPRPAPRGGGRGRRRTPARRSALLTVAVPSVCAMSVAGIAAASVSGVGGVGGDDKADETTSMAAADPGTVKPVAANNELDTQLANLSADAENFADRASRTQERIDLKERQVADRKKRAADAARREALRPKFVLPVAQHGLSAYYGQAGVNWMSVHTGIDFPVSFGTPVMAATDGTVRTQWNSAYGNMAIVTSSDGTETWYCHLSSTKIRSGSVQAGDVIAYSGSSGNSTGPHLHFEVRPGGGSAIDPLPWLRGHGINPN